MIWRPNPKQETALTRNEYEIGFGGSRGGGKTDAGQAWLMYDIKNPLYRGLVIRRNADDLKDWIDRARRMYSGLKAEFVGQPAEIRFPWGAIIRCGHLKDEGAYMKYQGHEYQRMLIEELTQIPTEKQYLMLLSSCRSTVPDLKPQVFTTFNPDGPGFNWVKRRFGLHGTPREPIVLKDPKTGLGRVFIPSKITDNPHLVKNDPGYLQFLDGLPDGLREAWRDGSWDEPIIAGSYYSQMLDQARDKKRIGIYPVDPEQPVYPVWDLGMDDAMAIGLFQKYPGRIVLVHYFESEGQGLPYYFAYLQRYREERHVSFGKHFVPFDVNQRELSTGKTRLEVFKAAGLDVEVVPKVDVADGIQKVRLMLTRLCVNESECEAWLSAMRNYRKEFDDKNNIYLPKPVHDWSSHCADMTRYASLVEDRMQNEEVVQLPERPFERISEYEPTYEDDDDRPSNRILGGQKLGTMGHLPIKHDE